MKSSPLQLSRAQILAHRRRVGALDERLPFAQSSLEQAASAGLQDSMPRAALLSLHGRVSGVGPSTWEHPSLVQLWGPRFSTYVVAARDRHVFTLGRLPEDARGLRVAEEMAARLERLLGGRRMTDRKAGDVLGENPSRFRYAAPTGSVLIRWDGARAPEIWTVPRPAVEPRDARLELARRYVHVFGPTTAAAFAQWAGISARLARSVFDELGEALMPVRTPIGDSWILSDDEPSFLAAIGAPAPARLLPSGDAYFLLQGRDRELLVPEEDRRSLLWTPRVWPGALLVGGEIAGTWRRGQGRVSIHPWRKLSGGEREAVEAEAASLPLPGLRGPIELGWEA